MPLARRVRLVLLAGGGILLLVLLAALVAKTSGRRPSVLAPITAVPTPPTVQPEPVIPEAERPEVNGVRLRPGLVGRYYGLPSRRELAFLGKDAGGRTPALVRVDPVLSFETAQKGLGSSGLVQNVYVRWCGYINAPEEAKYVFFLVSCDGSRLVLDGQELVNNGGFHALQEKSGEKTLKAGAHELEIEYYLGSAQGGVYLAWTIGNTSKELVAEKFLFHKPLTEAGPPLSQTGVVRHRLWGDIALKRRRLEAARSAIEQTAEVAFARQTVEEAKAKLQVALRNREDTAEMALGADPRRQQVRKERDEFLRQVKALDVKMEDERRKGTGPAAQDQQERQRLTAEVSLRERKLETLRMGVSDHPAVLKARQAIADQERAVAQAEDALAETRRKTSLRHPDAAELPRKIEEAEASLRSVDLQFRKELTKPPGTK